MNQDKVKEILVSVRDAETDFQVIFSGKESSKVNGLYKPDTREIILHNRNFKDDDQLLYTAFHEYAHHLHAERHEGKISGRAHGSEFFGILHGLLADAEAKGAYKNPFETNDELKEAGELIRKNFLEANGRLVKELGEALSQAEKLCEKHRARFDDFLDRVLRMPRASARMAIRASAWNVPPELGYDAIKYVSSIPKQAERDLAIASLQRGSSHDETREAVREARKKPIEDPETMLVKERERITRTIEKLEHRLSEINRELGAD